MRDIRLQDRLLCGYPLPYSTRLPAAWQAPSFCPGGVTHKKERHGDSPTWAGKPQFCFRKGLQRSPFRKQKRALPCTCEGRLPTAVRQTSRTAGAPAGRGAVRRRRGNAPPAPHCFLSHASPLASPLVRTPRKACFLRCRMLPFGRDGLFNMLEQQAAQGWQHTLR